MIFFFLYFIDQINHASRMPLNTRMARAIKTPPREEPSVLDGVLPFCVAVVEVVVGLIVIDVVPVSVSVDIQLFAVRNKNLRPH